MIILVCCHDICWSTWSQCKYVLIKRTKGGWLLLSNALYIYTDIPLQLHIHALHIHALHIHSCLCQHVCTPLPSWRILADLIIWVFFLLFNKTRTSVVSNFTAVGIKELIIRVQDTPDVQMNRYIDIHELNARVPHLPERQNHDVHVNT